MVLFWPIQQELDCINEEGSILGKIKFNGSTDNYTFHPANASVSLSSEEQSGIDERISGLASGRYSIPMQDDD